MYSDPGHSSTRRTPSSDPQNRALRLLWQASLVSLQVLLGQETGQRELPGHVSPFAHDLFEEDLRGHPAVYRPDADAAVVKDLQSLQAECATRSNRKAILRSRQAAQDVQPQRVMDGFQFAPSTM